MPNKQLSMKELERLPRHEQVRIMSEAMRAIDPEGWDAVAATVRKNVEAAKTYTPYLFMRKH